MYIELKNKSGNYVHIPFNQGKQDYVENVTGYFFLYIDR